MTVRELIENLKNVDQDIKVFCSKDAEGNDFTPLDDFTVQGTPDDKCFYIEINDYSDTKVVVLWPS